MNSRVTITSLRLERFGCFLDRTVTFGPGLNQIIGPNESGKSTILKALFTALFEEGSTTKKSTAALRSWTQNNAFRLTLKFMAGEKQFNLIRDYAIGCDIMTDSDGITYEGKAIKEKLSSIFGVADHALFEAVCCFTSDSPSSLGKQKEKLKAALEAPAFFGFDRVRGNQYLDEQIKNLDNPRAHGPRELDTLADQMQGCLHRKLELDERLAALTACKKELGEVQQAAQNLTGEIGRLENLTAGAQAYRELQIQMASLDERLQSHLARYSKAQQTVDDLRRVEKELAGIKLPPIYEIGSMANEGDVLAVAADEAKRRMDELINLRSRANLGFLVISALLILTCLVYIGHDRTYWNLGQIGDFIPVAIAVLAVVWLTRTGTYLSRIFRKKQATTLFREKTASLNRFYANLNATYDLKAADPIKAINEILARKEFLDSTAKNFNDTIALLSDDKGLEHLIEVKKQLESEVAQINRELAPLAQFAPLAGKLRELKEDLVAKRVRHDAVRDQAAALSERCSTLAIIEREAAVAEGELEMLKRKHKDLTEQLDILHITRAALNRAADELIEKIFSDYSDEASAYLSRLSGERYSHLRFSKDSGHFELNLPDTKNWIEVGDWLSTSTRDVVHLALDLAAIDKLAKQFAVPVFFDQADARMDGDRRHELLNVLSSLSATRQVFYVGVEAVAQWGHSHLVEFDPQEFEINLLH